MKVGIAFGQMTKYGLKESLYISDNNLKALCDILVAGGHEVTLLTKILEQEPIPSEIKYDPSSMDGEYDVILFGKCSCNILQCSEIYRLMYVLQKFSYKKALEIVIDTDTGLQFNGAMKHRGIRENDPHPQWLKQDRSRHWYNLIDGDVTSFNYQSIYNVTSGHELSFPFTLTDYPDIARWQPRLFPDYQLRNIYIGRCKPRVEELTKLWVPTDVYSNKLPAKQHNLTLMPRVKIEEIKDIYGQYMVTVITADKEHKGKGWILRRIAESITCGVPVLVKSDVTDGKMYGYTDITGWKWFSLTTEDICLDWLDDLKDKSKRAALLQEQASAMLQIMADFDKVKVEKFNDILCSP